jgi:hypothetical protein
MIQKSWVLSSGIYLYGWNIACVLVPSIIHSFRTDENYVTGFKTDENYVTGCDSVASCMLVLLLHFCMYIDKRNCGLEITFSAKLG